LTDKDALLLLTLATQNKPWFVFAAGTITFLITTAIIALSGYLLVTIFPVFWIKLIGGVIMICYAFWSFLKTREKELKEEQRKLLARSAKKSMLTALLTVVSMLALLDLAGDATELLIVVFVAHFQNVILVYASAMVGLTFATALETFIGNRLSSFFSLQRIRIISFIVFVLIGTCVIATTFL